ncbi:hypothetical protein ACJJI5_19835 [Microbulbifer sp. EKSA008]|uniref:hypothetical protein n=1 Tax=Microbulbifer sp. EKSA008 TaxID=3243367 RepID=UPI004041DD41
MMLNNVFKFIVISFFILFFGVCENDSTSKSIGMSDIEALNKGYPKLFALGDTEVFVHRLKDNDSEVFGAPIVVLSAIAEFSDPIVEECDTIAQPGGVKEELYYFWNKCNVTWLILPTKDGHSLKR